MSLESVLQNLNRILNIVDKVVDFAIKVVSSFLGNKQ